jgi:hypothetical protein
MHFKKRSSLLGRTFKVGSSASASEARLNEWESVTGSFTYAHRGFKLSLPEYEAVATRGRHSGIFVVF